MDTDGRMDRTVPPAPGPPLAPNGPPTAGQRGQTVPPSAGQRPQTGPRPPGGGLAGRRFQGGCGPRWRPGSAGRWPRPSPSRPGSRPGWRCGCGWPTAAGRSSRRSGLSRTRTARARTAPRHGSWPWWPSWPGLSPRPRPGCPGSPTGSRTPSPPTRWPPPDRLELTGARALEEGPAQLLQPGCRPLDACRKLAEPIEPPAAHEPLTLRRRSGISG
jgi:hypothetical protein